MNFIDYFKRQNNAPLRKKNIYYNYIYFILLVRAIYVLSPHRICIALEFNINNYN